MIIDIGTEVDESVIRWKYKENDEWQKADIDELIDAYMSIVRCKDYRHYEFDGGELMICSITNMVTDDDDFCSCGESVKK